MARPSGFVVVMGKHTPVCLGPAQKDPPKVRVVDASFGDELLSAGFWEAINPRVLFGEGWCDVGHIAPELCNDLCPINGTIILEADGQQFTYFVTCLRAESVRGAA
jgi:hypothetical protein